MNDELEKEPLEKVLRQAQDDKQGESQGQEPDDCAKCPDYLAGWKRAQADYANLKRETDKEKAEFAMYANERLLERLLPAIDQFETALAFTPDTSSLPEDDKKKLTNWITGLQAVRGSWETVFKDIGLEKVPTDGAFDPLIHEAVAHEPSETVEEGNVVRAIQSGWRLNGKLLRPARVSVSKPVNKDPSATAV
ncbi:nucleotide exchange factor GrpE [Candidatus Uhrbacteria bacterium]|nr:nucleotide exchange factor GrpE [Candidatus Uhrbacteria bacterium]